MQENCADGEERGLTSELYALARKVRVEHAAARGRLIGDDVAAAEHPGPIGDDVAVTRTADRILRRMAVSERLFSRAMRWSISSL